MRPPESDIKTGTYEIRAICRGFHCGSLNGRQAGSGDQNVRKSTVGDGKPARTSTGSAGR